MWLIVGGILSLVLFGVLYEIITCPPLPGNTDEIIDRFIAKEPSEFILGKTGYAQNGEVSIWYEDMTETDEPKGTILLVMGLGITVLGWSRYFFQPMLDKGYRVIRYDNRGLGMSDWMKNWNKKAPYSLEDMAKDGIAVLDTLGIQKVHVVGVSMGGMIAQRMAISHRDRILSMTSLMSSGFLEDPDLPQVPKGIERDFIKLSLRYRLIRTERNGVKFAIGVASLLKSPDCSEVDVPLRCEKALYEIRKRRGYNPKATGQHVEAVKISGSRYDELPSIDVPALVVHGKKDPLVLFAHAEKYAGMIPGARTIWIEDMGHEIPPHYSPIVLDGIFEVIREAEQ